MLEELISLKQTLSLQAHLLQMDLKDQWEVALAKLDALEDKLEYSLVDTAAKLGKAEENFFVGDEDEISQLVQELKQIKSKHED